MTEAPTKEQKKEIDESALIDIFNSTVTAFKLRWLNRGTEISPAGLYNYAMSVMKHEFHNIFDKETSEKLVEFYKP